MKHEILHIKEYFPVLGENDCDATLTTYLPDNLSEINRENEKHPCLLICPGGGYGCCSQREAEPVALNFLPDGFNVFVLNYSVAPHRYPTQLREVAAAMELIYRNAETWHCDTTHIAIMGFSAGGHLAAHYSTAYNCPEIRAMFPDSKPVQASVLCYPVITADPAWAHLGSFDALTGKTSRTSEEILKFSCDKLVTIHTPPAFLWHTAADRYAVQTVSCTRKRLQRTRDRLNCISIRRVSMAFLPATTQHWIPYYPNTNTIMYGFPVQKSGLSRIESPIAVS